MCVCACVCVRVCVSVCGAVQLWPWALAGGTLAPPPWNLKKVTSYAAVLQNTPKFSLAPGARHRYHIFQSKKPRKTQNFLFAPLARRKMVDSWYGAPKKRVNFLMCWWFCPPLEKFLRAPMALALYWRSAPDKARADLPGAASLTRVAP